MTRADSTRFDGDSWDLASAEGLLGYFGDRQEAAAYLNDHGGRLSGSTVGELFAAHGLPSFDDDAGGFADLRYVSGVLGGDE